MVVTPRWFILHNEEDVGPDRGRFFRNHTGDIEMCELPPRDTFPEQLSTGSHSGRNSFRRRGGVDISRTFIRFNEQFPPFKNMARCVTSHLQMDFV